MTGAVEAGRPVAGTRSGVSAHAGGVREESLLPTASIAMMGDVADALSACMAGQSRLQVGEMRTASANVEDQKTKIRRAQEAFNKAIDEQKEAERKANSFWGKLKKVAGKIAKVAALVAAAAAAVGTGGVGLAGALAVGGVLLSTGGMAVSTLKVFGKDSDKIGMYMELAGAAVGAAGCVAGLMAASQAAKAGAQGAATAAETATKASTFSRAMKYVQLGGHLGAMGAGMTSATAGIVVAHHQFDADMAAIDKERAQQEEQRGSHELKSAIEFLKAADEASRELLDATSKTIEACSQASEAAMTGVLKA